MKTRILKIDWNWQDEVEDLDNDTMVKVERTAKVKIEITERWSGVELDIIDEDGDELDDYETNKLLKHAFEIWN